MIDPDFDETLLRRDKLSAYLYKPMNSTTQNRKIMEKDVAEYVLNPDVPDDNHHRKIYKRLHPEDVLTSNDFIHHINGNHDDNRPENLMKVTPSEHSKIHWRMRKSGDTT